MTDLAQLAKDIQQLKDLEAIKRVKYVYFRCIDTANIPELREILDENVTATLVGGTYNIKLEGRDNYLEMIANGFHAQFVGHHNGHHPEIDFVSETEAKGLWYLADIAIDLRNKITTTGTSFYRDVYKKKNGKWVITHSGYERIYEIVEPMEKMPNLTSHYLAKHGRKEPTYDTLKEFPKA